MDGRRRAVSVPRLRVIAVGESVHSGVVAVVAIAGGGSGIRTTVAEASFAKFQPGNVIQVKYDPEDRTRVAVVHS